MIFSELENHPVSLFTVVSVKNRPESRMKSLLKFQCNQSVCAVEAAIA